MSHEGNPANTSRELYVWLEESSKSDYQWSRKRSFLATKLTIKGIFVTLAAQEDGW